jgi:Fe-S-cluster containining protein
MSAYAWLDKMLPAMACEKGCGECCTVVSCNTPEFDRIREYARVHGVTPRKQGITCPFYQDGGCAVYEARPFACRFYGHTPHMRCVRGHNTNVSPEAEAFIVKRYQALNVDAARKGGDLHLLHDFAYPDRGELVAEVERRVDGTVALTVKGEKIPEDPVYDAARQLSFTGDWKRPMKFVDGATGEEQVYLPAAAGRPAQVTFSKPPALWELANGS